MRLEQEKVALGGPNDPERRIKDNYQYGRVSKDFIKGIRPGV
jgi:hypothetical protein